MRPHREVRADLGVAVLDYRGVTEDDKRGSFPRLVDTHDHGRVYSTEHDYQSRISRLYLCFTETSNSHRKLPGKTGRLHLATAILVLIALRCVACGRPVHKPVDNRRNVRITPGVLWKACG